MLTPRISIQNFLRASEILIEEHDHYSPYEKTMVKGALSRVAAKISEDKDTEDSLKS